MILRKPLSLLLALLLVFSQNPLLWAQGKHAPNPKIAFSSLPAPVLSSFKAFTQQLNSSNLQPLALLPQLYSQDQLQGLRALSLALNSSPRKFAKILKELETLPESSELRESLQNLYSNRSSLQTLSVFEQKFSDAGDFSSLLSASRQFDSYQVQWPETFIDVSDSADNVRLQTAVQTQIASNSKYILDNIPKPGRPAPSAGRFGQPPLSKEEKEIQEHLKNLKMKGLALQEWGLPDVVPIMEGSHLRYTRLYRMNGMPTELGIVLYQTLAPEVKKNPKVLEKITLFHFYNGVQALHEGLKYGHDASNSHLRERIMSQLLYSEGYSYVEWAGAYFEKAKNELFSSAVIPGDKTAHLKIVKGRKPATEILREFFGKTLSEIEGIKNEGKEIPKELSSRFIALASVLGLPALFHPALGAIIPPITHRNLWIILKDIEKELDSKFKSRFLRILIRSFPMGESIYRMGVHRLKLLTGNPKEPVRVNIAVIDSGVDFDHPDLQKRKGKSFNFTRDEGDHTKGFHGTAMAGVIESLISVVDKIAPQAEVKIHSYQVLSNSGLPGVALNNVETEESILKAMDQVPEDGMDVVSISLGIKPGYSSDRISKKAEELAKKGITVVISAGNSGQTMPKGLQMGSPGASKGRGVLTKGAVDYHGLKADFSSERPTFDPENHEIVDKPLTYSYGVNTKIAAQMPLQMYLGDPMPYAPVSGTSPATPHDAFTSALMILQQRLLGIDIPKEKLPGLIEDSIMEAVTPSYERTPTAPREVLHMRNVPRALRIFRKKLAAFQSKQS